MADIQNVCVFCGSSDGSDSAFKESASRLGRLLAESGIGLVFGGSDRGLMGAVARSVLEHGGRVTGIVPGFLNRGAHIFAGSYEHVVVDDMHTRKRMMFERSDAFVALPGGIGTLEELAEQMTWAQIGHHDKPIVVADISGFWRPLLALLDHMREQSFVKPPFEKPCRVADTVEDILPLLRAASEDDSALARMAG